MKEKLKLNQKKSKKKKYIEEHFVKSHTHIFYVK